MRWKLLEKITSRGKPKDSSLTAQENTPNNSQHSSLYEVKIKKIKKVTIKNKENGKQIFPMDEYIE